MTNTNKKIVSTICFVHNATQTARKLVKYEDGTFSHDFDNNNISRYKEKSFYIYIVDENGDKLQLATKYNPDVAQVIEDFRKYVDNQKALEKAIKEQEKKQSKATKTKSADNIVMGFVYTGDEKVFSSIDEMLKYDDIDKIPALVVSLQQENALRQGKTNKKLLLATYEKDLQTALELVAKCENALNERSQQLDKVLTTTQADFDKVCLDVMTTHNNATLEKRKSKITKTDLFDENARLRELVAKLQAQANANA